MVSLSSTFRHGQKVTSSALYDFEGGAICQVCFPDAQVRRQFEEGLAETMPTPPTPPKPPATTTTNAKPVANTAHTSTNARSTSVPATPDMPAQPKQPVHPVDSEDVYWASLRGHTLSLHLSNGETLTGALSAFTRYTLRLADHGREIVVLKHAIAWIEPSPDATT
jgi:sRNA-binding regulator protein Hfq